MTEIEKVFKDRIPIINTGGFGFMGKEAKNMTHDELLIAFSVLYEIYLNHLDEIRELRKKILC